MCSRRVGGEKEFSVINEHRFVLNEQSVPGNRNTTLDVVDIPFGFSFVPVARIFEHDHVATVRVYERRQAEMGNLDVCEREILRRLCTVNKFIDEQKIADPERVFHRRARNAESFDNERFQEEGDDKGGGDGRGIIVKPLAGRLLASVLLFVELPPMPAQEN